MGFQLLAAMLTPLLSASQVDVRPVVRVSPAELRAGSCQRVTFDFNVGSTRIDQGGGIRIELPVAYLETEPYYWDRPQTDSPDGRGYVRARSTGGAVLDVKIGGTHGGIVECIVRQGSVKFADQIILEYTGVVQSLTWELPVRTEWRRTGQDPWQAVDDSPVLTFRPENAVTLFAVAPADVQHGIPFDLAVVVLDKFGNRAGGYRGTISLASTDPDAQLPDAYTFTEADAGVRSFKDVRYNTAGFQKITLADGELEGRSNYSEVHASRPERSRYFGETHFHTGTGMDNKAFTTVSAGGDHRGHFTTQQSAYTYVRDVMRLDFASASEHDTRDFDEPAWEKSQSIADAFYDAGRFTTLYAYEWTASPTEGHHVILYKDREGKVLNHFDYPSKPALYEALQRQQVPVCVIPHMMWAQPDHGIWDNINNRFRTVGEIYSLWNNRFLLQPGDEPQRFELGIDDRWSYQYAWHRGHRIGVIGSTDNHTGRPAANNDTPYTQHTGGLAVVWAEANTRQALWDAIQQRRTYATTGTRILLEFTADGHCMGEEYITDAAPVLVVKAAGSNTIQLVEIVKYDGAAYRTIRSETPESEVCMFRHRDDEFTADSMYYLRVTQVDEHYRSPWSKPTCEMAWSSPIWIARSKPKHEGP
ncbi:MAG: DUF3604 domain-containing protein [Phycisphaerales bacterium]|nr:MAG: DUF3604 domain-containing protein [Phycisphaerales bacterium]